MTHEEFMKEACRVNSSVGALITYGLHPIARGFWGIHPRYQNLPVFHAEAMAILNAKLDRGNCNGATLYVNKSPCRNCAELIIQAGIRAVYYMIQYEIPEAADTGINRLKERE
jgi:deoxycytidylate deaminase